MLPQGATRFADLLAEAAGLARPGVCLVLVLPSWRAERDSLGDSLAEWRGRGASVIAFVVDDRRLLAHDWGSAADTVPALELLAELGVPARGVLDSASLQQGAPQESGSRASEGVV